MGIGGARLEEFLESVAAGTPTPGGGSVAAVCGAMAAALTEMVAALGLGKEAWRDAHPELPDIVAKTKELRADLLRLADEDAASYDAVVTAMRLPRRTDEEKARRRAEMQTAFRGATEVPLETVRRSRDVLHVCLDAAKSGSQSAITDAGVAALLAETAMRSAGLNVKINLAAIADEAWRAEREDELAALLKDGAVVAHEVDGLVASRL